MKWVFLAALLALIPALVALLHSQRSYRRYGAFAMGLLPFAVVFHLYVAPVSWADWPGPVKGIEVSFLDAVALAVLLSTPKSTIPLRLKLSFGILVAALLMSTSAAYQTIPAVFYAWQLLRSVILFLAVVRLCASDPPAAFAMMAGLGVGLCYESIVALIQYLGGAPRPGGDFGHSNFLGLASDFVVFPALSLFLAGRKVFWYALIVAAGLLIAVVGGSRATLGLFGAGFVLTIFLSLWHRRTSRKLAFACAAGVLLCIATPALFWGASRRSDAEKVSSDQERTEMKLAASMMVSDHPLGVGADQYVIVANTGGYSARAGVPWNTSERLAPVHDTYYLVAAEFGYLGLLGLVTILLSLATLALGLIKSDKSENSELVAGLLATVFVAAIHISFEWVFMNFVMHYLFAISAGMLVAIRTQPKKVARMRRLAPASRLNEARAS